MGTVGWVEGGGVGYCVREAWRVVINNVIGRRRLRADISSPSALAADARRSRTCRIVSPCGKWPEAYGNQSY